MRCPLLRKGRPDTRQTANEYVANFRPRGTDFFRSSLAAQLEDEELAPADLTAFYHGHLKACRYLKLFIQKLVYEEDKAMKEKFTFQQKTKLLTKLFDAGCNTEKKLQQLDMESILKIPGITIPDMSLIIELQKQTKANKLFSYLGGGTDEQAGTE